MTANAGWVNVGTGHDTAAFAVESIRRWWNAAGSSQYPQARRLECVRYFVRGDFLLSGSGCLSGVFSSRYLMPLCPFYSAVPPNRAFRSFPGLMLRVPVIVPSCSFRVPLPDPPGIAWRPFPSVI